MIIKKVYNKSNWSYSNIPIHKQLGKNNAPVEYMNSNIFQSEYIKKIIHSVKKPKKIVFLRDKQFKASNITKSRKKKVCEMQHIYLGENKFFKYYSRLLFYYS